MPGNTGYGVAKGGMRMLTSTAGVDLTRHNILVNGVGPGAVATPVNLGSMNDQAKLAQLAAIRLGGAPQELRTWSAFLPATAPATSPRPRCSPTGQESAIRQRVLDANSEQKRVARSRIKNVFHHHPVWLALGSGPGGPTDQTVDCVAVLRLVQWELVTTPLNL
jgi:hypothetical protein